MGVLSLSLVFGAVLVSEPPATASPCPPWRERQTFPCMRGYLKVDPLELSYTGVGGDSYLGYGLGFAGGFFRDRGHLALALGMRLNYAFLRDVTRQWVDFEHFVHTGPELRVGKASGRVFGFFLLRAGYTRWIDRIRYRDSESPGALSGGHVGVGGGVWGRVGRRLLVGGEATLNLSWFCVVPLPVLNLSLALGTWL